MFGIFLTAFAGIFWFCRVMICLISSMEISFPIVPVNITFEIITLFITFACIIFIAKRKMLGAVIYLITQVAYFGVDGYKNLTTIAEGAPTTANYISLFITVIAIIIPILVIMDIGLNNGKGGSLHNKKTAWFYDNEDYDRKYDEGADRNQYKF